MSLYYNRDYLDQVIQTGARGPPGDREEVMGFSEMSSEKLNEQKIFLNKQ